MSTFTLQHSANFASSIVQYIPLFAGLGGEPSITFGNLIRNSFISAPQTWYFNRNTTTFNTVVGQQDYTEVGVVDLDYVEKVTIQDDQGNIWELKDTYNNQALASSSFQQRPSAMAVMSSDPVAGCVFRFMGVPDQIYAVSIIYQKLAPQFGPFFITSVAAEVAGNTAYTGNFDVLSFPTGAIAVITGLAAANNNGSFVVVSCTSTVLTVANSGGTLAAGQTGYVSNYSWSPIPDQFSDIYNNLYLSEVMILADDARAAIYRQRGIAAFLSRSAGLTETQKNAFTQQWLARGSERMNVTSAIQQGQQGRGV